MDEEKYKIKSNTIVCLGIGGCAVFYVAKYLQLLGNRILGYDIEENSRIRKLKVLENVKVILGNPTKKPFKENIGLIIYTAALPDKVIEQVRMQNPQIEMIEAGVFVDNLTQKFEKGDLEAEELRAFKKSGVAPLYALDYSKQKFIGVTGTDGKTTTCSMIYHALQELGYRPGMVSTVEAKIGNKSMDTGLHTTTPSAQELFKFIRMMQSENCTHIILECTSHGLVMGRLSGVKLDVAVYTNIKKEHLDYHKTWKDYAKAKSLLITRHLKPTGTAVLNKDDRRAFDLLKDLAENTIAYTTRSKHIEGTPEGLKFELDGRMYALPILGRYNVENALAAIEACKSLGIKGSEAAEVLGSFKTVCGRMSVLQREPFYVIVDFAHTPNALKVVLQSVQKLKRTEENKIILVFGCAGKRDHSKRFSMGKLAKKYADITILTAEDPRSESLKEINNEIESGWNSTEDSTGQKLLFRFDDASVGVDIRRQAVIKALNLAEDGDVVLITGKGHEQSLCFGVEEYVWNDIDEVEKILGRGLLVW